MNELEELEQKVADTKAASEAADKVAAYATYVPAYLSYDEAYALIYAPIDDAYAANANYVRAKKKLATYLKEQDNNG
jgi:hypothetical protein